MTSAHYQSTPGLPILLPMSHCHATTRKGLPCRFRIAPDADYCINHVPGADTIAASARATAASKAARQPPEELMRAVLSFTDRASIQSTLDSIVRLKLAGQISDSTARIVIRACSIAAHNFDPSRETLAGPQPQSYDWFPYFDRINALLHSIQPILAASEARQAARALWDDGL